MRNTRRNQCLTIVSIKIVFRPVICFIECHKVQLIFVIVQNDLSRSCSHSFDRNRQVSTDLDDL